MYKPSYLFDRTPEEKKDPFKSWARDDQAFFATGACHILAELFVQLHGDEGYYKVHIKPAAGFSGNHVYATNGVWAFDHDGWTKDEELLAVIEQGFRQKYPDWNYERRVIKEDFETFCKDNNHRLPWQFAHLPWERAYSYIQRFGSKPRRASEPRLWLTRP